MFGIAFTLALGVVWLSRNIVADETPDQYLWSRQLQEEWFSDTTEPFVYQSYSGTYCSKYNKKSFCTSIHDDIFNEEIANEVTIDEMPDFEQEVESLLDAVESLSCDDLFLGWNCGKKPSCSDVKSKLIDVIRRTVTGRYAGKMGMLAAYNKFYLGAYCTACDAPNHSVGELQVLKDNIEDDIEDTCENAWKDYLSGEYPTIDLLEEWECYNHDQCQVLRSQVEDALEEAEDECSDPIEYFGGFTLKFIQIRLMDSFGLDVDSFLPSNLARTLEQMRSLVKRDVTPRVSFCPSNSCVVYDDKTGVDAVAVYKAAPNYQSAIKSPLDEKKKALDINPKGGLSGGAIAGIVIAVLIVVIGIALAVYFLVIKKRKGKQNFHHFTDDSSAQSNMVDDLPSMSDVRA